MPNIKSAKKRVKTTAVQTARNTAQKSALKTAVKKFDSAVIAGDKAVAEVAYKDAVKKIDKAADKNLMHKNNAANKKSKATLKLNAM